MEKKFYHQHRIGRLKLKNYVAMKKKNNCLHSQQKLTKFKQKGVSYTTYHIAWQAKKQYMIFKEKELIK